MLNTLHIQNFRLFQNLQIDDLARVNLIVGKNNVGKSSLLEAAFLLVNANPKTALTTLLENRGELSANEPVRDDLRPPYSRVWYDISHLFFDRQLEGEAAIKLQANNGLFALTISYIQDWEQLSLDLDAAESPLATSYLQIFNGRQDKAIKIPLEGDLLESRLLGRHMPRLADSKTAANYVTTKGFDYELLAGLWDAITLTPKEDNVVQMLQVIDETVERISFTSRFRTANFGILVKQMGSDTRIPLGSLGDGLHRLLTIAVTLANSENGFLFIDEIDTGLHYRTITDMWRLVLETAARLNVQVFATTHSWDCLRSFSEALNLSQDKSIGALFRLQKRGKTIQTIRYEAERMAFAIEQEIEIR